MITQLHGDCLELLETLDAESVQTIVTSPPYWQLRRYTSDPREIGREPTPAAYVTALVAVFRACRRVLRKDGTLWINLSEPTLVRRHTRMRAWPRSERSIAAAERNR